MTYSHKNIEEKWQKYWKKNQTFYTDLSNQSKAKKYVLVMFPYPSGAGLHVGHVRCYTIADAMVRFYRLLGYNVLFPMGWDAFGLPAEQYAIQTRNHPATFTANNIKNFKKQLIKLGFSFDWSKEINTSQSDYYHWTQWIFKQIYLKNLAEYKEIPVYWCEKLGTVLANEEIKLVDGKKTSERGSYPVVQKSIFQWVLKITNYVEQLLTGLQQVDWPNSIKSLQTNWIGISRGTLIDFSIVNSSEKITVFTTRPDTIYGVVAIALAINHPLISKVILPEYQKRIADFCTYWATKKETKEVIGEFIGSYCLNPLIGEKVPIWITNFVISDYGTGAVMIAPFFDREKDYSQTAPSFFTSSENKQNKEIDFAFAQKYSLPIKKIFQIDLAKENQKSEVEEKKITDNNHTYINSPLISNLTNNKQAIEIINDFLVKEGKGKRYNNYHLRDWIFSRQRYWGEPIPVYHYNGQQKILLDEQLPLKLPPLNDFTPDPQYYAPLQKITEWVNIKEKGKIIGQRDVNVMPQWAGSCWYYIAYLLKKDGNYLALNTYEAKQIIKHWLPVDLYIGGQEHANLHLLYARFWHKVLQEIGIVNCSEPFQKLLCQGMILGKDGQKMSKSIGNMISPDECIEKYGADALRLYEIFIGPPEQTTSFDINGVKAMKKWLNRVYVFFGKCQETKFANVENETIKAAYYQMLSKVSIYYQEIKLNLIIPCLMTFINECYKHHVKFMKLVYLKNFLKFLYPLTPHIAEEIWSYFEKESITYSSWPEIIKTEKIIKKTVNLVVQINGKKKEIIITTLNKSKEEVITETYRNNKLKTYLENKKISKIIFVKNKLINFVIAN